eukprot:14308393-Ditylum_brightwellii.AAC.1
MERPLFQASYPPRQQREKSVGSDQDMPSGGVTSDASAHHQSCMLECVLFAITITNLWKVLRCDDIVHQHLVIELFLAENCVVDSAWYNQKPLIESILSPLDTAMPVGNQGLKSAKPQGGIDKVQRSGRIWGASKRAGISLALVASST